MSAVSLLYVEDDPGFARLVERVLSRSGYAVTHTSTIADGLALMRNAPTPFDIVLLDHRLPDGTGLDFLAALGEARGKTPIVYITALEDTRIAVAALKRGAADYVPKDASGEFLELLLNSLESALAKAQLERDKETAEQEIREARDRAELLLREVNHRVSNSLTLVAALLRMQAKEAPELKDALDKTQARITAIADIHRSLYTSHDVKHVQVDAYLASLIGDLERAIGASTHANLVLRAEPLHCSVEKAIAIGMLITELVTNAIKYAYPDGRRGEIRIKLIRKGEHERDVWLIVEDDGVGWRNDQTPRGTGLGRRVIEMMAASLGGALELEPAPIGTRAVVRFSI